MGEKVRAHVRIHGRVQGVCYRMKTQQAARAYGVVGWVKNVSDGSVEAVFEGDDKKVRSLIDWCRTGPSNALVKHVDVQWEDYADEFGSFEIEF